MGFLTVTRWKNLIVGIVTAAAETGRKLFVGGVWCFCHYRHVLSQMYQIKSIDFFFMYFFSCPVNMSDVSIWYELFTGRVEGLQSFTTLINTWLLLTAYNADFSLLRSVLLFYFFGCVPLSQLIWFYGLMQKRRNPSALTMELRLFCIKPSNCLLNVKYGIAKWIRCFFHSSDVALKCKGLRW